jgi:hypothetical protein
MMFENNFRLELILHAHDTSAQDIRNSLVEFAQDIEIVDMSPEVASEGKDFKLSMRVQDPTMIFDLCGQFGRIRSVKVEGKG